MIPLRPFDHRNEMKLRLVAQYSLGIFTYFFQLIYVYSGIDIVRKALRIPCYTIASNAGVDAQEVVTRVMMEKQDNGYDALHGTYVDMIKAGIIDPTKVCY